MGPDEPSLLCSSVSSASSDSFCSLTRFPFGTAASSASSSSACFPQPRSTGNQSGADLRHGILHHGPPFATYRGNWIHDLWEETTGLPFRRSTLGQKVQRICMAAEMLFFSFFFFFFSLPASAGFVFLSFFRFVMSTTSCSSSSSTPLPQRLRSAWAGERI